MSFLDTILKIGSYFDYWSPLIAGVQDIVNGPSRTFLIPDDCGKSGREIEQLLRRHGIKTWGLMIVNDTIMVSVRQKQARRAQYLLQREGIRFQ